ncbi:MAG: hypothetical protein ACTSX0_08510 [Promethearchaeota archaeon]
MVIAIEDVIFSLLLNLIPLLIFTIPIPFFKRKTAKRAFYLRLYYGLCFFFAVYWILPALLQFDVKPLSEDESSSKTSSLVPIYLILRSLSLISTYAQYPFVLLPLIFVISPFISLLILYLRIRKEEKNGEIDLFQEIHYEYIASPKEMIKKALRKNDWSKEKEMFKAFLIVMPIAIYLLAVILDISGLEPVNLNKSSTAIGMLIEIFFVYIATFLYGYQLIKASRLAFRGKFIGEQIEARFFTSLKEVGTPIAILSIILFVIQQTDSLLLFIYIFGYFLMAAFTFILFMRIFEPISILILLKIINYRKSWKFWASRKRFRKHFRRRSQQQLDSENLSETSETSANSTNPADESASLPTIENTLQKNLPENFENEQTIESIQLSTSRPLLKHFSIIILYGFIATFISVTIFLIFNLIGSLFLPTGTDITQISAAAASPSYSETLISEISVTLHSIELVFRVIVLAFFFNLAMRTKQHISTVIGIYGGTLLIFTILFSILLNSDLIIPLSFTEETSWITGVPVYLSQNHFTFYTVRTGFLTASFSGNMILRALTIPFYLFNPFCLFILWGFLFYFINRNFKVKSIDKGRNYVERVTYSLVNPENVTDLQVFFKTHPLASIERKSDVDLQDLDFNEPQAEEIRYQLQQQNDYPLKSIPQTLLTDPKFKAWLISQLNQHLLFLWIPEFSCIIERAQIDSIYLLYKDGRNLFYYQITETKEPENELSTEDDLEKQELKKNYMPSLVSGMFSAITSFVKEVTNSADLLRSIDSGDKKVILEYSTSLPIFGAIFADRETGQVRRALKNFLTQFGNKYGHLLVNWSGDVSPFYDATEILQEVFKEFL